MAEQNTDTQTGEIMIEQPKEHDSFLEENLQIRVDDDEVPYPYEYPPPYAPPYSPPTNTYLPSNTRETFREKRHKASPKHIVNYRNQGPLLPQEVEQQQQLNPPVQYIVIQEAQPTNKTRPVHVVPCGLAAIIVSVQTKDYAKKGDYVKAKSSARCGLYLIIASVLSCLLSIGFALAKVFHKI